MSNRYLVPLKYLVNSNSHSNFKFEDKIEFIAGTYPLPLKIVEEDSDIALGVKLERPVRTFSHQNLKKWAGIQNTSFTY
jgi:hypothetical protein